MKAWQIFLTAYLVGFTGAIMPGPLLTVSIKESMRRGGWTGPKLIFGHAVLELSLVIAIFFGFGAVLARAGVKGAIGFIGGAMLLWMAVGMIGEARSNLTLPTGGNAEIKGMPLVLAGALVSLSNPYWTAWWATAGLSQITHAQKLAVYGVGIFFAGHILADLTWYSAISFTVARGRRIFSDRVYRAVVLCCGMFLVYIGLWFIDSAFGFVGISRPSVWFVQWIRGLWGS